MEEVGEPGLNRTGQFRRAPALPIAWIADRVVRMGVSAAQPIEFHAAPIISTASHFFIAGADSGR